MIPRSAAAARLVVLMALVCCCCTATVASARPTTEGPLRMLRPAHTPEQAAHVRALAAEHHSTGVVPDVSSSSISKCELCFWFFDIMDGLLAKGTNLTDIEREAELLCGVAGVNGEVCNGAVVIFAPEFVYLMNVTYRGHSHDMCWMLNMCQSTAHVEGTSGWRTGHALDALVDATASAVDTVLRERAEHATATDVDDDAAVDPNAAFFASLRDPTVGTILHLTDLHYDEEYTPGTSSKCGKPTCCHPIDGEGIPPYVAGPFGDYHCDGAPALQAAVMAELKQLNPKPDFVLWTGDEAPDDVWRQSRTANLDDAAFLANAVADALPGVVAFPTVGNHEPFPIAQLDAPAGAQQQLQSGNDSWLYDGLAQIWSSDTSPWLDVDAVKTMSAGGYYSQLARPGLRVISLNTQHGNPGNYWLMANASADPSGQLSWLQSQLSYSAAQGEQCYIIAHIPFGNEMFSAYSARVHDIIDPYHETVSALFFGHTHMDSFQVRRDLQTDTIPQNIAFVAPSVTPQTNINPSYRVYTYNRTTSRVLDYAQYTADLTRANADGVIMFELAYTAKASYNMTGFEASDWQDVVNRMHAAGVNSSLVTTYVQHHVTTGRPTLGCESSANCVKRTICDAASFTPDLYRKCMSDPLASPVRSVCSSDVVQTLFVPRVFSGAADADADANDS